MFHSGKIKGLCHAFKGTIPHLPIIPFPPIATLSCCCHHACPQSCVQALNWSHHATFPQNPWAMKYCSQGGRTEQAVLLSSPHFRAEHPPHPSQLYLQPFLSSPALECIPGWDAPEGSRNYWSTAHDCQPASTHPVLLSLCESQ